MQTFKFFLVTLIICFFSQIHSGELKKNWANFTVELKKSVFLGSNVKLEFLFKNLSKDDDTFSSIMQLEAISGEGDRGELNFMQSDCDGSIPPLGMFKCKAQFTFPSDIRKIFVIIGAGILADAVYFNIEKNSE